MTDQVLECLEPPVAYVEMTKFKLFIGDMGDLVSINSYPPACVVARYPVSRARAHELLVRARNELARLGWQPKGWGQVLKGCADSPICLMNAIGRAMELDRYDHITSMPEGKVCAAAMGFGTMGDAMAWNDRSCTSIEMALARLDQGIKATAPEPEDPMSAIEPVKELVLA